MLLRLYGNTHYYADYPYVVADCNLNCDKNVRTLSPTKRQPFRLKNEANAEVPKNAVH